MSVKIEDLDPQMQAKVRTFLSIVPIPYVVTSTLRTTDEQVAYYVQGRAPLPIVNLLRAKAGLRPILDEANHGTVTNCDGVNTRSNHQGGKAIDVVPQNESGQAIWPPPTDGRWLIIGKSGEEAGLTWGGRWTAFQDLPHYETV